MIQIHKNRRSMIFIFHHPGACAAWIFDGKCFLRFIYLQDSQEFRFVRAQAYLPANVHGQPFDLAPFEIASLQREARLHRLNLRFFGDQAECILQALPVNLRQTVYDLFPPAGSITAAGIATRRNPPSFSRRHPDGE